MSAEMGSFTETVELYVPLLNEGTDVLRPTKGVCLGNDEVAVREGNDVRSDDQAPMWFAD